MEVVIRCDRSMLGDFAALDRDRASWKRDHGGIIIADPRVRGTVLEIGAAAGTTSQPFDQIYALASAMDGVDPDPAIHDHARLRNRWEGLLEDVSGVPEGAYDAAIALLVVEHVATPRTFLERVFRSLKPGGVFYATTVSSRHPFAWMVRTVQALGLKGRFARQSAHKVNEYPAHYRMNSPRTVVPIAKAIGFSRAEFFYHPCVQWDAYFPRWARWAPHLYDRAIGIRFPGAAQVLMYRLEKPGAGAVSG